MLQAIFDDFNKKNKNGCGFHAKIRVDITQFLTLKCYSGSKRKHNSIKSSDFFLKNVKFLEAY